jgi:hypothetical protein
LQIWETSSSKGLKREMGIEIETSRVRKEGRMEGRKNGEQRIG